MNLKTKFHTSAPEIDISVILSQIVGSDSVLTTLEARTFFSTDIASSGAIADAVVVVSSVDSLSKVVKACTDRGWIVIPRGGGFSYTGGYTPQSVRTVIVDIRPMNRIVQINTEDLYVIVEAGCTWERLYEALKLKGVRTPYFGPMSGYRATVGGALSQGSFFLGANQYGTVSDSVLGIEVVLSDGSVLRTGSWGSSEGGSPFLRQYGPDLTGIFLSDTGAMGFKSRVVLKLIPFPARQAYGSFAFTTFEAAIRAVSEVGRSGLAAECYCWDPYFVKLMAAASTGTKEDIKFLINIVKAGSSLFDGLGAALQIALAGKAVFTGDTWLMHIVVDDATSAGANGKLKLIRKKALTAGGSEVSPSAPRALRGTPFVDFNTEERRVKRRNLPVHGLVPHSSAEALATDIYAYLSDNAASMKDRGVSCGVIFVAVGSQSVCIEPLIYWEDDEHFLHNRVTEISDLAALGSYTERPAGTQYAFNMRKDVKAILRRHNCAHLQIGRAYPWAETRDLGSLNLIKAIKKLVDPKGLVNRGALGLGIPDDA